LTVVVGPLSLGTWANVSSQPSSWPVSGVSSPSRVDPFEVDLTRRRLLMLGGTAIATATACAGGLDRLVAVADAATRVGNPLRRSRFVPHVGEHFRLSVPGGGAVHVKLDEIQDLSWTPKPSAAGAEDGFVLVFHGPPAPRIAQGVVRVRHARLGSLDLLVSPAGTGRRGQDYAAVVNRLPLDR